MSERLSSPPLDCAGSSLWLNSHVRSQQSGAKTFPALILEQVTQPAKHSLSGSSCQAPLPNPLTIDSFSCFSRRGISAPFPRVSVHTTSGLRATGHAAITRCCCSVAAPALAPRELSELVVLSYLFSKALEGAVARCSFTYALAADRCSWCSLLPPPAPLAKLLY